MSDDERDIAKSVASLMLGGPMFTKMKLQAALAALRVAREALDTLQDHHCDGICRDDEHSIEMDKTNAALAQVDAVLGRDE